MYNRNIIILYYSSRARKFIAKLFLDLAANKSDIICYRIKKIFNENLRARK